MLNVNLFINYITVINIIMMFVTDCVRKARWIWHFFCIRSVTKFLMNVSFCRVPKLFVCWYIFERWRSLCQIAVFISLLTVKQKCRRRPRDAIQPMMKHHSSPRQHKNKWHPERNYTTFSLNGKQNCVLQKYFRFKSEWNSYLILLLVFLCSRFNIPAS